MAKPDDAYLIPLAFITYVNCSIEAAVQLTIHFGWLIKHHQRM